MTTTVRWLPAVSSTQDAVHALAEAGAPAGTAVAAHEQSAGRGSRGRRWASPAGGLWLSVLLRPDDAGSLDALSLRVGLALVRLLEGQGGSDLAIKWPNDIMAGGRKAGGILCEARWNGERPAWVTVGVGLNLRNAVPEELAGLATRLADHGVAAGAEVLAGPAAEAVVKAGAMTGPLNIDERLALADYDWLYGRAVESPVAGIAEGLLADGGLRVRQADGTVSVVRTGPVMPQPHVTLVE